MRQFISLIALLVLSVPALADIGPEYREFRPPEYLDHVIAGQSDLPNRNLMPAYPELNEWNPVWNDQPGRGFSDMPEMMPNNPGPLVDQPAPEPNYDEPQQFDQSRRIHPVEDPPLAINSDLVGGRVPIIMPPIFRDRIDIQFGPGFGRMSGSIKVYSMNGRLALEERFSAAGGVSIGGARVSSLAAGSYVVEIDCGPGFYLSSKSVKLD